MGNRHAVICAAAAALVWNAILRPPASAAQPTFQGLGHLPGHRNSEATGVSAGGSVIVGVSVFDSDHRAFRWTREGGMLSLGDFNGAGTGASDVSADGSVVVGTARNQNYEEAFRWTSAGGMKGLGFDFATGVSDDGSVIVGASGGGQLYYHAVRWTRDGGVQDLGVLPGDLESRAHDISGDGSVIVGASEREGSGVGFIWTSGTGMVGLPGVTNATGVSPDGSAILGRGAQEEAVRWTSAGGARGLGVFSGGQYGSNPGAANGDGSIVLGSSSSHLGWEAFIWDGEHGMRRLQQVLTSDYGLDLTGWTLRGVGGISADGSTIVGSGINPQGLTEAWVVTIPEPSALALLAVAGILLPRRRGRLTPEFDQDHLHRENTCAHHD